MISDEKGLIFLLIGVIGTIVSGIVGIILIFLEAYEYVQIGYPLVLLPLGIAFVLYIVTTAVCQFTDWD